MYICVHVPKTLEKPNHICKKLMFLFFHSTFKIILRWSWQNNITLDCSCLIRGVKIHSMMFCSFTNTLPTFKQSFEQNIKHSSSNNHWFPLKVLYDKSFHLNGIAFQTLATDQSVTDKNWIIIYVKECCWNDQSRMILLFLYSSSWHADSIDSLDSHTICPYQLSLLVSSLDGI